MSIDYSHGIGFGFPLPYEKYGELIKKIYYELEIEYTIYEKYLRHCDSYVRIEENPFWYGVILCDSDDFNVVFFDKLDCNDEVKEEIQEMIKYYREITNDYETEPQFCYFNKIW